MITTFDIVAGEFVGVDLYPKVYIGTKHGWPTCYECDWEFNGKTVSPGYIRF